MAHSQAFKSHAAAATGRLSDVLKKRWENYRTWRAKRATVFALHALDDHALKDMGFDRSEIESVVYGTPCGFTGNRRAR